MTQSYIDTLNAWLAPSVISERLTLLSSKDLSPTAILDAHTCPTCQFTWKIQAKKSTSCSSELQRNANPVGFKITLCDSVLTLTFSKWLLIPCKTSKRDARQSRRSHRYSSATWPYCIDNRESQSKNICMKPQMNDFTYLKNSSE